jgi:hypothetical protein
MRRKKAFWKTVFLGLMVVACMILPQARAGEARMFEGVDLSKLRQVQSLRAMAELYELDPATRRYGLRDGSFHIPLGQAWILYNPELNLSYLNKVPGENAAAYFGPVPGDAFEVFKIEERMNASFRTEYPPDALYRLRLMVRSGHPRMREKALRIATAALAPEIELSVRRQNVSSFREMISELKGDDVTPVLAAIQRTEKQIEDATPTYSDDQFTPGNDALEKQGKLKDWMKVSVPVPESAWGEALNGLRGAAVFSSTSAKVGEKINVWLLVENASDHDIRFSTSDPTQNAHASVKHLNGTMVEVTSSFYTGISPVQRHKLKPRERLTLAVRKLVFDNQPKAEVLGFGESHAAAGAGEYLVRYDPVMITGGSGKNEWSGMVRSGETRVRVGE